MTTSEIEEKMAKLRATSDALTVAKRKLKASHSYHNAVVVQKLRQDYQDLRATLPPLRLIHTQEAHGQSGRHTD